MSRKQTFNEGDKVFSIFKGWGVIKILRRPNAREAPNNYPIMVHFDNGDIRFYDKHGKHYSDDAYPEIYHTEMAIYQKKNEYSNKNKSK